MLSLPYYVYDFFSTKLEMRSVRFCLEARGEGKGRRRNEPDNVCTCD
jgi:hypothetical protein